MNKNQKILREEFLKIFQENPIPMKEIAAQSGIDYQCVQSFLMNGRGLKWENWLRFEKYLVALKNKEAGSDAK